MADQTRPLAEEFARLPEWVQGAMFSRVVDVVLGMGRDEKYETRRQLYESPGLRVGQPRVLIDPSQCHSPARRRGDLNPIGALVANPLDGLPLPVQFACMPEYWQGALLSITDVLGGMTRDEMEEAHRMIDHVSRVETLPPKTAALLRSVVGLTVWVEVTIDEDRINAARQMWATENEEEDS